MSVHEIAIGGLEWDRSMRGFSIGNFQHAEDFQCFACPLVADGTISSSQRE